MYATVVSFALALLNFAAREASENFKMKNSYQQWDSTPVPPARYYAYVLSIA